MSTDSGGRMPRKLGRKLRKRAKRRKAGLDGEEEVTEDDGQSNAEEVPDMIANLSAAALDGMDADNVKELEKEKRT